VDYDNAFLAVEEKMNVTLHHNGEEQLLAALLTCQRLMENPKNIFGLLSDADLYTFYYMNRDRQVWYSDDFVFPKNADIIYTFLIYFIRGEFPPGIVPQDVD